MVQEMVRDIEKLFDEFSAHHFPETLTCMGHFIKNRNTINFNSRENTYCENTKETYSLQVRMNYPDTTMEMTRHDKYYSHFAITYKTKDFFDAWDDNCLTPYFFGRLSVLFEMLKIKHSQYKSLMGDGDYAMWTEETDDEA